MRHRGRWASFVVGGAVLAALLLVFVPMAASSGTDEYTATVTPNHVAAGATAVSLTFTIANDLGSADLGSADIAVNPTFGAVTVGATTATGGKSWSGILNGSGDTIQLRAGGAGDTLPAGQSVSVQVTANAPTSTGPQGWATQASASLTDPSDTPFVTNSSSDTSVIVDPDHFDVSAPAAATAGDPFDVTVTAKAADGSTISNYVGTVHFSSTDPGSQTVVPLDYPFTGGDNGVHTFTNGVTLTKAGSQTVSVADTVTTSATGNSDPITVGHASLDHFTLGSIGDQIAGGGFSVSATAEDAFENPLGGDYSGTPSLSGTLHGSPRGCPDATHACTESYGNPPSVSAGVATWNGVKGYLAETGRTVTATGGSASGTSNPFAVGHASLDHFTLGSIGDQIAGGGFSVSATAEDAFENPLGGDYSGTPSLSGTLHGSPRGCPDATHACTESYGNPPSVSAGVATWNGVKGYLAETGRTVTATGGSASGTSNPFAVGHASLDHFTLGSIGDQIAGGGFSVSATAEDAFENPLGGDYSGTPSLSGTLHGSPRGCPDATHACTESYGNPPSVSAGVATWNGVKGYLAETGRTVTATGGSASGTSNPFAVGHASLDHFTLGSDRRSDCGRRVQRFGDG